MRAIGKSISRQVGFRLGSLKSGTGKRIALPRFPGRFLFCSGACFCTPFLSSFFSFSHWWASLKRVGCIAFSPLAQGVLTDKYLAGGIPEGSRASKKHSFLRPEQITDEKLVKVRALNELAHARSQSLAQMALSWVLRHPGMTSVLIGASKVSQIEDGVEALKNLVFSQDELQRIDEITLA